MSLKSILSLILWFAASFLPLSAKQGVLNADSLSSKAIVLAKTDSLKQLEIPVADTLTPKLLKLPDSATQAFIAYTLKKGLGYPQVNFKTLINDFLLQSVSKQSHQNGALLPRGQTWVFMVVAFLVVAFAVYKASFSKQLMAIVQSFFSNRVLANLNKEENLFNSWPFVLLFVQFGFTIGLYLYLVISRQNEHQVYGFNYFMRLAVLVIALAAFKVILLRIFAFFLKIQKPINEYITVLYLSYFNLYLLFIPLNFAYALSPITYHTFYMLAGAILFAIIFIIQLIRVAINILFDYQFSKVYLFLYFCALEICPILIFIKTIGYRGN